VASDGPGVASAKGAATLLEPTGIEQRISRRMSESKATVPDFALEMEVECGPLVELREKLRELSDPAPSLNDLVVKAAAIALRRHPRVNGSYRDGRIELYERVNVGVAVASSRGLFVPTVFDADKRGLATIAARVREVADAVRDGSVSASDLGGGTFTISNLGMFGVARFTAVINPPQAAILTVGTVREKLKLEDEQVSAVPVMDLTLCCDHRVLDGAAGSEFLVTLRGLLEEPLAMAL
jgi:pyruvate dehydrogenase E2 component (dihydrolipoamide acetyltransferase)